MKELLADSGVELLTLLATVAVSGLLSVAGGVLELQAIANIVAGEVTLGAWELAFGGVLLYGGVYLVGYQQVVPRVRERSA